MLETWADISKHITKKDRTPSLRRHDCIENSTLVSRPDGKIGTFICPRKSDISKIISQKKSPNIAHPFPLVPVSTVGLLSSSSRAALSKSASSPFALVGVRFIALTCARCMDRNAGTDVFPVTKSRTINRPQAVSRCKTDLVYNAYPSSTQNL